MNLYYDLLCNILLLNSYVMLGYDLKLYPNTFNGFCMILYTYSKVINASFSVAALVTLPIS